MSLETLWDRLARAPSSALLLDYDGTLAPFRERRMEAIPYPGVRERLRALVDRGRRVVVVSGRPVAEVLALLAPERPLEIWGAHGVERQVPGAEIRVLGPPPEVARGLDRLEEDLRSRGLGDRIERKAAGIAVHVRGLPPEEAARVLAEAREALGRTAPEACPAHEFDGGLEIRWRGRSKGDAVRTILQEVPGGTVTAYLGDDRTDEDAFEALGAGGWSILVRETWRPTRARAWIRPPDELLDFLDRWLRTTPAGSPG